MTTESWAPPTQKPSTLAPDALAKMLAAGKLDHPDTGILDQHPCKTCNFVMKQDLGFWQAQSTSLDNNDIIALIRFFTIAEQANDAWFAGADSPVIHLNKILKSRGQRLDKATLLWIKQNSDNHYLPNGPIKF